MSFGWAAHRCACRSAVFGGLTDLSGILPVPRLIGLTVRLDLPPRATCGGQLACRCQPERLEQFQRSWATRGCELVGSRSVTCSARVVCRMHTTLCGPTAPVNMPYCPCGSARTVPWRPRSWHTELQSTRCSTRAHATRAMRPQSHMLVPGASLCPSGGTSGRALPTELEQPAPVDSPGRPSPVAVSSGVRCRGSLRLHSTTPLRLSWSPSLAPVFGPFRLKNGCSRVPSPRSTGTKLARIAVLG